MSFLSWSDPMNLSKPELATRIACDTTGADDCRAYQTFVHAPLPWLHILAQSLGINLAACMEVSVSSEVLGSLQQIQELRWAIQREIPVESNESKQQVSSNALPLPGP